MFLIIIGVILLLVSYGAANPQLPTARYSGKIRIAAIGLMILGLLLKCVVQIEPGHVGVQKLFGQVQDGILSSGLTVVNPMVDIIEFDVRTRNYTMSGVHDEGEKAGDDAIRVLSADGLELVIDLTVLYKVKASATPSIVNTIGTDYQNIYIRPVTRTKIRDNAVYYDAVALYSTKRQEFQNRIYEDIKKDFDKHGLILEQLLIRNIALPTSVKQTIESKINAEQEAQKMQFVLQKEKQEAERKRVEAQGIADYQRILSQGLSDKMLQYENIKAQKEIATSQNAKVIIMNGKSNAPILIGQ